jgi:nitrate reductase gamma subunit
MVSFAEFVDGPFWYFSAIVFLVGVIWRMIGMLTIGGHRDLSTPRASGSTAAVATNIRRFIPRRDFWSRVKLQTLAGYLFHVGLFALLFFAAPHIEFYEQRVTGFGWAAMPEWAFILASELAFLGLLLLVLHRMMHPVTRLVSGRGDYIGSTLIFLVMLTGCLALARSYESLRVIHFFLAELLLIYFPFSSLMHTFTFAFSRGFTGAHYGRRGVRV